MPRTRTEGMAQLLIVKIDGLFCCCFAVECQILSSMGTKFVSFTLVMLSGAVQTWLPPVKEKTAFISVYAKSGQIFRVFKGNLTTQKKEHLLRKITVVLNCV